MAGDVRLLLGWREPTLHGAAPGCAAVCVDTLRHVLLTTDLSKHAGAAEDAAVALAPNAQRVDCLIVCGKHGQGIALATEML